jgi:hypothetical protein
MKLDIKTKEGIDKWFDERTLEEVLFIAQKYMTQDKLQLLQSRVVGTSEQFYCDGEENNNDRCESQCLGCAGMEEINSQ